MVSLKSRECRNFFRPNTWPSKLYEKKTDLKVLKFIFNIGLVHIRKVWANKLLFSSLSLFSSNKNRFIFQLPEPNKLSSSSIFGLSTRCVCVCVCVCSLICVCNSHSTRVSALCQNGQAIKCEKTFVCFRNNKKANLLLCSNKLFVFWFNIFFPK